jgi:HSP20 family protein
MALNKATITLPLLKRAALEGAGAPDSEATWTPNTDVYLADTGLVVTVELAGLRREDLELTVEGNQLRVSGVRRDGCRSGRCRFIAMEINYGAFETRVEIPPGFDLARAKAAYQNGFLRIEVPPAAAGAPLSFSLPVQNGEV